ncbi:MAG: hypothetical protein PVI90_12465, partial [Desulfobacteraceae bacterium]
QIRPDLGSSARRSRRRISRYVSLAATSLPSKKTSKMVDLFLADTLKGFITAYMHYSSNLPIALCN